MTAVCRGTRYQALVGVELSTVTLLTTLHRVLFSRIQEALSLIRYDRNIDMDDFQTV